jgi:hypothetical protein
VKVSKELGRKCLVLAGGKPARARPKGRPKLAAGWAVELSLPCVVVSEANQRCHWAVRKRRGDVQRATLSGVLRWSNLDRWEPELPVVVTFTHVGRTMDDDNLRSAFKVCRDFLAKWLGCDDSPNDPVTWNYDQTRGTPGVRIRIEGV